MLARLLLVALSVLAGTTSRTAHAAESDQPNVVMIISDDQAWTDYGFMGHPTIKTPHLDKLSSESATFINGYVPTSLCRPSLATLISGQYPHQHRITGNDPPKGTDRREMLRHIRAMPKLPVLLGEAGYVSHQSGKWWEGNFSEGGFTAGMTHGDPAKRGRHGDEGLKIGRDGLDQVWEFLDGTQGKPFFLWYAPFLPHQPHNPPERLLTKYDSPDRPVELAKYYAMCEWFDETCGALLDGLERRGMHENTLVVYVTDNGWIQKTPETDLPPDWKNPFAPKSKRSPYDGGVRTPIMLRWPGKITPARCETLVSSVDLAPTILHACGLTPPAEMPGQNLLEVAASGGKTNRDIVFGEIFEHDEPDIDDPTAGLLFRWCRHGNFKLVAPMAAAADPELYDLGSDPHEMHDIGREHPEKVAELLSRLDEWWTPGLDDAP
ncbi:MAG: sulfatase [Planctomycetota bacterium]|nr:sulfatase [Planctomycetaceae bacterium]MDQ3332146.1 sulfatase [Planctomycetota bacterium]